MSCNGFSAARTLKSCHGRQGSQGLVLGWILRNRKLQQQDWHAGEVAATMASLPAKNLPWRPYHIATFNILAAHASQTGVHFTQNSSTATCFAIFTYFLNALMLHFGNVHHLGVLLKDESKQAILSHSCKVCSHISCPKKCRIHITRTDINHWQKLLTERTSMFTVLDTNL